MRAIDQLLITYGESHQNASNKLIHWICVPLIMFSLVGLIREIPFPSDIIGLNWAVVFLLLALGYYFRLSFMMFLGFVLISLVMLLGVEYIHHLAVWNNWSPSLIFLGIFAIAWVGQFYGHHIEGKRPSFLQDLQFLLIGPAWLLHFIYKKLGVRY